MIRLPRFFRTLIVCSGSLFLLAVFIIPPSVFAAPDAFTTITPNNIEDLELGYALPGPCGFFSPDGKLLLVWNDGVYDLASGERRVATATDYGGFSPDGKLVSIAKVGVFDTADGKLIYPTSVENLASFSSDNTMFAIAGDGVYDRTTLQRRFPIANFGDYSPDSKLFAVDDDGVYDTATGKRRFPFVGEPVFEFSPDSKLIAVWEDGVYDALTGERRFSITGAITIFSPDSQLLAVGQDGVYETSTGNKRFSTSSYFGYFNPDSTLIPADEEAVYDTATGKSRFAISGSGSFSKDGTWIAVDNDGIYDVATGNKRFAISHLTISSSPDDRLISVSTEGIYATDTGKLRFRDVTTGIFNATGDIVMDFHFSEAQDVSCLIYGLLSDPWPYRSAIIKSQASVNIYDAPDGNVIKDTSEELVVFGRTEDNKWLKLGDGLWIQTASVDPILVLEDIPVVSI